MSPGIRSLLRANHPIMRSDGRYTCDYVYIQDVAEADLLLAEHLACKDVQVEAFSFSPESRSGVIEVLDTLPQLISYKDIKPVILNQARAKIQNRHLDSSRTWRTFGWRPHYGLSEELEESIAGYRDLFGEAT